MSRFRVAQLSLFIAIQLAMLAGLVLATVERHWLDAFAVACIMLLTLLPALFRRRFRVFIPPEFELLVIIFVFASLFLGEVRGYYVRFWWWDLALHSGSALLLGMFSFMLVYVLNEERHIELHMKAGFAAFFSFTFALGVGALWEIFEFGMDGVFGLNMQKSGLVDTMWDLIVDAAGALLVSVLGYAWMRSGTESFVSRGIARFVQANPQFFERRQR
jgi:hypothetical protein